MLVIGVDICISWVPFNGFIANYLAEFPIGYYSLFELDLILIGGTTLPPLYSLIYGILFEFTSFVFAVPYLMKPVAAACPRLFISYAWFEVAGLWLLILPAW